MSLNVFENILTYTAASAYLTAKLSSCSRSSRVMRAPELKIFLTPLTFRPMTVRQLAARSRTVMSGSCTRTQLNVMHFCQLSKGAYSGNAAGGLPTCNKVARADVMPHATHCSYENLELSNSCAARSAFCRISKSADLSCPICHNDKAL